MADNDVLRRDGVLVRITGFDDERTAYFGVMPNGHTTQLTFPRQEVFDGGRRVARRYGFLSQSAA